MMINVVIIIEIIAGVSHLRLLVLVLFFDAKICTLAGMQHNMDGKAELCSRNIKNNHNE